jgi:hypothetical protein
VSGAVISDCGRYRYTLEREWMTGVGTCLFVMLNPSTADASEDDPTIRRCIGFAQRWGYRRLAVGNLYAFRATNPKQLWEPNGPVGEFPCHEPWGCHRHNRNDHHLEELADAADRIVVAWGANPGPIDHPPRYVADLLAEHHPDPALCLGTTKSGAPRHPLYVPKDFEPQPYELAVGAAA